MKKTILIATVFLTLLSCSQPGEKVYLVKLTTTHGDIKLRLYNETPLHRDNFISLVEKGFYNDIMFHRIRDGFMIQTGNPQTKKGVTENTDLSPYRYTLPAEIVPGLFHKKGAVAAARTGAQSNPLLNSSGTQFYIVQGVVHTDSTLKNQEARINKDMRDNLYYRYMHEEKGAADSAGVELSVAEIQERAALRIHDYFENNQLYTIPAEQREIYKTTGGSPHLDMNYTVFGEVTEGLDVIDKIAAEKRDANDRPLSENVRILKAEIVKR